MDLLLNPSKRNTRTTRTIYGEYGQTRYARINATTKYITRPTGHVELYDLVEDENETKNLLEPSPSNTSQYSAQVDVSRFDQALKTWFSFYEEPNVSGWTVPVTGKGQGRTFF